MNMKPMTLEEIAAAAGGQLIGNWEQQNRVVADITLDSRTVREGSLFVAVCGERSDGHDFIPESFRSGAVCCLSQRELTEPGGPYILVESTLTAIKSLAEYYRGLFSIPVIGVTGSVGKTTAKEMIYAVLSRKYLVHKTSGNFNNEIGVPMTLFGLREEHQAAVVEMGISGFGEMRRLSKMVRPDIVVMSVIGSSHLEFLGDRAGVLRAKGEIYEWANPKGLAVVNGDDPLLSAAAPGDFSKNAAGMKKITCGFGGGNDFRAEELQNKGWSGTDCKICCRGSRFHVEIPAFGRHMVYAALFAAAAGDALGLSQQEITAGIRQFQNVGKRTDISETPYFTIIDDCYNANPNSMEAAVGSIADLSGRRVCILGDMGELGESRETLHREVGGYAARSGIDSLICVGNLAEHIYLGARETGQNLDTWYFRNKTAALAELPSILRRGDTVLVKASRSMKFEDIVTALKQM